MSTPSDIIEALGGPTRIARALNLYPTLISEWKRTDSIPVKHWPALISHAEAAGKKLDADALVEAHLHRNPPPSKKAKAA